MLHVFSILFIAVHCVQNELVLPLKKTHRTVFEVQTGSAFGSQVKMLGLVEHLGSVEDIYFHEQVGRICVSVHVGDVNGMCNKLGNTLTH